jgi:uncharacterized protein YndB with AHSA1/START domain
VARNEITIPAPVEVVFAVLADPRLYAAWVVGASTVRAVEGRWPQPGATFRHTQLLVVRDSTSVLASDPPTHLRLEARVRPVVVTVVDAQLRPEGAGTRLVIEEWVTGGALAVLPRAVTDVLVHLRNTVAVARLKRLAEVTAAQPAAASAG